MDQEDSLHLAPAPEGAADSSLGRVVSGKVRTKYTNRRRLCIQQWVRSSCNCPGYSTQTFPAGESRRCSWPVAERRRVDGRLWRGHINPPASFWPSAPCAPCGYVGPRWLLWQFPHQLRCPLSLYGWGSSAVWFASPARTDCRLPSIEVTSSTLLRWCAAAGSQHGLVVGVNFHHRLRFAVGVFEGVRGGDKLRLKLGAVVQRAPR